MESAMSDMPLALFTTFSSIGAGAFLMLFIGFLVHEPTPEQLKRLDKLTLVLVLFPAVGLICSFMHLANAGNAFSVLNTIGSTPLANEILVFGIFLVVAILYWVLAIAGALKSRTARLACSGITGLLGILAVVFMGLAYAIPTIPTWDSPWTTIQLLGAMLLGGAALAWWAFALADRGEAGSEKVDAVERLIMIAGGVVLLFGTIALFATGASATSGIVNVAQNSSELTPMLVVSIVLTVIAVVCGFLGRSDRRTAWLCGAVVIAWFAVFFARLCFYGMQITIGL